MQSGVANRSSGNERWMSTLESALKGDGAFVAVGIVRVLDDVGLPATLSHADLRVDLLPR